MTPAEKSTEGTIPEGPVTGAGGTSSAPWSRLSVRMVWADGAWTLLSLAPMVIAVWVFDQGFGAGTLWPLLAVAVVGVLGAAGDALRWVFTRYRVTGEHVELRTGVFVRNHRSVRRDRIRSVDLDAKLWHRLLGLRVVNIGAGQQAAAGESAFELDSVSKEAAQSLRRLLLFGSSAQPPRAEEAEGAGEAEGAEEAAGAEENPDEHTGQVQVLAGFRPGWFVYNMFNVWAYVLAVGLLWGVFAVGSVFGVDPFGWVLNLLDVWNLHWVWAALAGVAALGVLGAAGMAVSFLTEYWNFQLARVPGTKGTLLRTRQGLFRTREINRDENRIRGVQVSEPVLWRWLGVADTTVITTGLEEGAMSQPTAVLPRGPVSVARPTAAAVLATAGNPLTAPLRHHPRTALGRRLWWATLAAGVPTGLLAWAAATGAVPWAAVWAVPVVLWPLGLVGAVVAHRALGHAIADEYVVLRSGLANRATTALRRDAVSTVVVRESVVQRWLGLRSVSAMTSAGAGGYETPDIAADESTRFAAVAAPGILDPFLVTDEPATGIPATAATAPTEAKAR
ncbi:PH domain-containing protein [Nocardiopsis oceani]